MRNDSETLGAFAATLNTVLSEAFEEVRYRHPLLRQVKSKDRTEIGIMADVGGGVPMLARYEIPRVVFNFSLKVDSFLTSQDRLVEYSKLIIPSSVHEYERSVRTGLYSPSNGFLGLAGLLPPEVGANEIGGISEVSTPGWKSLVTYSHGSVYRAFVAAERRSMRAGKAPDLTVFGTSAYRELVSGIQPQQRFHEVSGGISMLVLHTGAIFHDPFCVTDTGYMVHSEDFKFIASPFEIATELTIDGRLLIQVRRREQMVSSRRFSSGTITSPPLFLNVNQ